MRILCVDDDQVTLLKTVKTLQSMLPGDSVWKAGSGDALQESLSDSLQRLRAIEAVLSGAGSNDDRIAKIRETLDTPRSGLPSIAPKSGPQVVTATKQLYNETAGGWLRDKPSSLSDF